MKTFAARSVLPSDIAQMVKEGVPFRAGKLSGFPGHVDLHTSFDMAPALKEQYRKARVSYTLMSYETPVAWVVGQTWTIPDHFYSATTDQHLAMIRRAAGAS